MVKEFLVEGSHLIRRKVNKDSISAVGFEILISKQYSNSEFNPDSWMIQFSSALGAQDNESYLDITEINLAENGEYVEGDIHLFFHCNMYFANAGDLTGDFARTFSGEFKLAISYKK